MGSSSTTSTGSAGPAGPGVSPEPSATGAMSAVRAVTASGLPVAPGIPMRSHTGTLYRFDPGALSLELLTTGGPGAFARFEVLHTPDDLVAWAGRSRLTPTPSLDVTDDEVTEARRLRDALFRTVVTRLRGDGLPEAGVRAADSADLDHINRAAARPPLAPALTPDGTRRWAPGTATGAHLLSTAARDAVELLTGPYADRIRMCSGERCFLVYVDTSRPGRRRWCSMEHCGNRHKVRAHRARRSEPVAPVVPVAPAEEGPQHAQEG